MLAILVFSFAMTAMAQTANEKAWRLHNRIAGVPPQPGVHAQMASDIQSGNYEAAAQRAMQNPEFYNTVLKNMFKPLSGQARSSRVPLNDFTATLIGAVRDSDTTPFKEVLYGDFIYVGPSMGRTDGSAQQRVDDANRKRYRTDSNEHYETMEARKLDMSNSNILRKVVQSSTIRTETFNGSYQDNNGNTRTVASEPSRVMVDGNNGAAGVLTSRSYGLEFFSAGTNRRVTRYTFMNFMCKDFEDLMDITLPDFMIARDVDRAPGGDSRVFANVCSGCHRGQDSLRPALAYYDWDDGRDRLVFSPGTVRTKMNHNSVYPEGFVTQDDSFINLWAQGKNASLGWPEKTSGNGIKEWGQMFAESEQFARCMAQRVFKQFCYRSPDEGDLADIEDHATQFRTSDNYNFKALVRKTSAKCIEGEYEN
jgi:hypothetical protein